MRFRLVIALVGIVTAAGCGAAASGATPARGHIEPNQSIDRLRIGMTPDEVRARYGSPDKVRRLSESETGKPILDWVYRNRKIVATMRRVDGKRFSLAGISTTSRRQKTAAGSGVGSTEDEVRRNEKSVDCDEGDAGKRWCIIDSGDRQTIFVIDDTSKRVEEVRTLITW